MARVKSSTVKAVFEFSFKVGRGRVNCTCKIIVIINNNIVKADLQKNNLWDVKVHFAVLQLQKRLSFVVDT